MALVELRKNPSQRELEWFGLVPAVFCGIVGTLVWAAFEARAVAFALWSIGLAVALVYYAVPAWRVPIYRGWSYGAYPLGWLVTAAALAVAYFLVITPIGLALRLAGRDPLERALQPNAKSYWVERRSRPDVSRYFKQF